MDEKNPLQIYPTPSSRNYDKDSNKGGRPTTENVVKFGPQPRSIISQMLSEMKTKSKSGGHITEELIGILEDEPTSQNELTQDIDETNKRSCSVAEYKRLQSSHQQLLCDFPNCSYSCKLSSNLIKHKRVHTNEKPYLCETCSFRTNFVNSLKAHKRIHTAEKPYHCDQCSYRCNSSSNLKKHCHLRHPDGNKCKYK